MPPRKPLAYPICAYVVPFALYGILTSLESSSWIGVKYEDLCILKGVLAAAAFGAFYKDYPKFSVNGVWIAVAAGVLGFGLWLFLERVQASIPGMEFVSRLLLQGKRAGFNPFVDGQATISTIAFLGVRLIELIIIVPIIEEIFWRGFLSRYLIAEDFQAIRQGDFTPFSFAVVTLAFTSTHPELLAAITWCAIINILYSHTRNIWACVLMHSVTNGLLGAYILASKSWHLW